MVRRLVALFAAGVLPAAGLAGLVEEEPVEAHEGPGRERAEVRPQLGVAAVELDVGRLHVDGVRREGGERELGVLRAPSALDLLHELAETASVDAGPGLG